MLSIVEVAMSPSRLGLVPLLFLALPALASPATLGSVTLDATTTAGVVQVSACTKTEHKDLARVGWEVMVSFLTLQKVVVTFGDGTTQTIQVGRRLAPGSNSAGVALDGGPRCVKQIQLVGKGEGTTTTRVWGDPHVDE